MQFVSHLFCVLVYKLQHCHQLKGSGERTEHLDIFLISAHHSMVFYFRCSVYSWKGVPDLF